VENNAFLGNFVGYVHFYTKAKPRTLTGYTGPSAIFEFLYPEQKTRQQDFP
jgi:hypothetical protein